MAAEYVMAGGNYQVILCERGVRTFSDHSRNTLDLSVIPPAKALSHLPIFVDPSHGTGKRAYVPPMSLAALAAGADGLIVEAASGAGQGNVRWGAIARLQGLANAARFAQTNDADSRTQDGMSTQLRRAMLQGGYSRGNEEWLMRTHRTSPTTGKSREPTGGVIR